MLMPGTGDIASQRVTLGLTPAAIFIVATVNPGAENRAALRGLCPDIANLERAIGFRDLNGRLSCVVGFGSAVWDELFGQLRPAELHPFREIRAGPRRAPSTPGDVLFHIRAERMDLCFELASLLMTRLHGAITAVDEVHGFAYFDQRDLLGFVDGTENPEGQEAEDSVFVGAEDPAFAGGSYVVVQKYLHDLAGWNALPTELQEGIIGRTKLADVELDAEVKPSYAHNQLNKIVENGREVKILRANMAFGEAGRGEFGTYYIGYVRSPRTIEQMLDNMFIGVPPGNYDRLLEFSTAVTGTLFFVPSASFLANVGVAAPIPQPAAAPDPPPRDGSLGIGSLKGEPLDE